MASSTWMEEGDVRVLHQGRAVTGQVQGNMLLVSKQKSSQVALAGLTFEVTSVELERMIPEEKGTISMEVLLW